MALAASCKRVLQIGMASASIRRNFSDISPLSSSFRYMSQLSTTSNAKRAFLVDTLALVRGLEAQGIPSKQAEGITAAITLVSSGSVENLSHSFVSKLDIQKIEMNQEFNMSQFKSDVKSSQEQHFSSLQHETEKLRNDIEKMRSDLRFETEKLRNDMEKMRTEELRFETEKLRNDTEKMRSELRYEIDKVAAGLRLDLNLEKGRINNEIGEVTNKVERGTTTSDNKIDQVNHSNSAKLEALKYEVIKYCVGTFISISAIGLAAIIRVLM